jgi:hypothetical protein
MFHLKLKTICNNNNFSRLSEKLVHSYQPRVFRPVVQFTSVQSSDNKDNVRGSGSAASTGHGLQACSPLRSVDSTFPAAATDRALAQRGTSLPRQHPVSCDSGRPLPHHRACQQPSIGLLIAVTRRRAFRDDNSAQ